MRDRRVHQKAAVQSRNRPHYRDHHMPPDKDRDMSFKDIVIVFLGVVAALGIIAVITGWLLDATYKQVEERTGQVIEQRVIEQRAMETEVVMPSRLES
ncbi:MAG: hypothetical protein K6L60_12940 [Oceanobacter sp.]